MFTLTSNVIINYIPYLTYIGGSCKRCSNRRLGIEKSLNIRKIWKICLFFVWPHLRFDLLEAVRLWWCGTILWNCDTSHGELESSPSKLSHAPSIFT